MEIGIKHIVIAAFVVIVLLAFYFGIAEKEHTQGGLSSHDFSEYKIETLD